MLTWTAFIIANVWVWFAGLYFGISVHNGTWQSLFRVSAIIGCIIGTFFTSIGLAGILWNATHASNENDQKAGKESLRAAALSTCLQLVVGIIAIVETEMTMRVNDIQMGETLSSSGQRILFGVSIFLFVATVGAGFKNFVTGASHLAIRI